MDSQQTSFERRLSVLFVEDDRVDAQLVRMTLAPYNVVLRYTSRVDEALAMIRTETPDAILLDLSLPDAARMDALRWTVCEAPDVPIIALIGEDSEAIGLTAIKLGAQDYLPKADIVPGLLDRVIRYAIERVHAAGRSGTQRV